MILLDQPACPMTPPSTARIRPSLGRLPANWTA